MSIAIGNTATNGLKVNCSATYNSTVRRWAVTIPNVNFDISSHVVTVSALGTNPLLPSTSSNGGKLLIFVRNASGTDVLADVCFVVY